MREYAKFETIVANIPYVAMLMLGAVTIASACGGYMAPALIGAAGYIAYGIAGAVWIMVFVCPYCAYYATRSCPCGYGMVAAKFVKTGERQCFAEKFKRHIPVIVPLWLIPPACGAVALWRSFSWPLTILVSIFVIESWVILPLVSKRHGCADCPQKKACPWMREDVA